MSFVAKAEMFLTGKRAARPILMMKLTLWTPARTRSLRLEQTGIGQIGQIGQIGKYCIWWGRGYMLVELTA